MKFINLRLITIFALIGLLLSSCDKVELAKPLGDRGQTVVKFITAPNDNGTNYNLVTINLSTTPQSLGVVDIRRDAPNETELNKTLTVTVKEDPAVISAFNIANSSDLVALPSASYTVDAANPRTGSDYTVTFQPGEFAKWLKINIPNSAALDLSKRYAIGLTIVVAVSGADGRVSFENRSTVVEIGLKNKWDGIYKLSGYTLRDGDPVKTGNFAPIEMQLITISPNAVSYGDLQIWADGTGVGIGVPILTISEATVPNPVTVSSSGGATNIPGPSNYYSPASKTFSLDFTWGAGISSRRATVTLEYLRPR
ncbi:MAG TPA: DUF1735 domain-containing protein [Chitinophagaceae bacterium]|jgi:hypothetical protein|nr:DUF1735 domain-containing protein [Chitinophagaceae bacterium]